MAGNRDARSGAEQMNAAVAHFGNHLSWANERKKKAAKLSLFSLARAANIHPSDATNIQQYLSLE